MVDEVQSVTFEELLTEAKNIFSVTHGMIIKFFQNSGEIPSIYTNIRSNFALLDASPSKDDLIKIIGDLSSQIGTFKSKNFFSVGPHSGTIRNNLSKLSGLLRMMKEHDAIQPKKIAIGKVTGFFSKLFG
tara:strand:- start:7020 stop:7409 length:390 start_codon:yes stop_codon:yes gene_type:complete